MSTQPDSYAVAQGLRDAAAVCPSTQAALAERLKLGASVIESLLVERGQLLERLRLAEFAARTNRETIARMQS